LLGLFVLMVPGFLFSLVLYPRREGFDFWKRMGASLGLGVLLLIYVGFVLAQPGARMLEAAPFIGAVLTACVVFAILAYLRGGFEVVTAYKRAAVGAFRKLGPSKPPQQPPAPQPPQQPPAPQPPQPPQQQPMPQPQPSQPEQVPEKAPEEVPEQVPEKTPEPSGHSDEGS